jgi:hypothetical protein
MNWRLFKDESIKSLLNTYLSFIFHAYNDQKGRMRNFMGFERNWLEEVGSEDSHGRTLWALGYTIAHPPGDETLGLATRLFKDLIDATLKFTSPRAWAFAIVGANYYLRRFGGDARVRRIKYALAEKIKILFDNVADDEWYWFENIVAYDNARISQALIVAGNYLEKEEMFDIGLKSLEWLIKIQTNPDSGQLSLIGNDGWYRRGENKARYDQQVLDATALVDACYQAFVLTGDDKWLSCMEWAFNWFFGSNDGNQALYDFSDGGCFDGLQPGGINKNKGAESVTSMLLALQRMHLVAHQGLFQQNQLQITK